MMQRLRALLFVALASAALFASPACATYFYQDANGNKIPYLDLNCQNPTRCTVFSPVDQTGNPLATPSNPFYVAPAPASSPWPVSGIFWPYTLNGDGGVPAHVTNWPALTPSTGTGRYSAATVGTSAASLGAATPTVFLDVINDSATATVAFCFGSACTPALNGAGSITLPPGWHRSWEGTFIPTDQINAIASAASTPVTVGVK